MILMQSFSRLEKDAIVDRSSLNDLLIELYHTRSAYQEVRPMMFKRIDI